MQIFVDEYTCEWVQILVWCSLHLELHICEQAEIYRCPLYRVEIYKCLLYRDMVYMQRLNA